MKKIKKITAMAVIAATAVTGLSAINGTLADDIRVELDGAEIAFDVHPQIINGRTMVPLRKIFEEIGALVKWDSETQTVTARKSSKTVTLSIGSDTLTVDKGNIDTNGDPITESVTLDVPAQIISGRTLVPARAISESFGLDVDWDDDEQKVIITSSDDTDEAWKENTGTIDLSTLSFSGNGIEVTDKQITITQGGDFTLSGDLSGGSITISATDKVKLRLSGASITSGNEPCIFVENADKAYITLTKGTENTLVSESGDSGAIYSKDNLEIKGKGTLSISSSAGHGIKASDNLTIENGSILINAASDGIHVNDTFKMTGGNLDITAVGDGIDSESIVNISGGEIKVKTTAVPASGAEADVTENNMPKRGGFDEKNEVEFEKSSKGINAEWMLVATGGDISINSASHAIHCADEIQIDGGNFVLSSDYEKGISAHGNLTVNGTDTKIDISKSTEGIESKNILTVNDGTIKVYSTDDAINATGGNSGAQGMPDGNFGRPEDGGTSPERLDPPQDNQRPEGNGSRPGQRFDGGEEFNREGGGRGGEMKPMNDAAGEMPTPPEFDKDNMPSPPDGGEMPGGGHGGRSMKDCLVINGGYLELYAEDDCLDSNGNLIINGGTIKATNPTGSFSGAFAVIDPDGQTTISEDAVLIFAAESGNAGQLGLSQNTIVVYCDESHSANDTITVSDSDANIIYEYTPLGSFGAVLISSKVLTLGEGYTVTIGNEQYEITLSDKSTTLGTAPASHGGGGGGRRAM